MLPAKPRRTSIVPIAGLMVCICATGVAAQQGQRMEQRAGVWIEGPGFEITYGGTYDACAQRCLGNGRCAMIEFYRPERKCNLYDAERPTLRGGSSNVAVKR